ncbi:MAG: transposase [Elusimicrobia bacterium]|nr:MAG: transposase [Elusimicrobiota bacterium]
MQGLCTPIRALKTSEELKLFLEDLLTPAELKAISERWTVVLKLEEGNSYRRIYEETGVSTATVTRVARALSSGAGGYRKALDRLGISR